MATEATFSCSSIVGRGTPSKTNGPKTCAGPNARVLNGKGMPKLPPSKDRGGVTTATPLKRMMNVEGAPSPPEKKARTSGTGSNDMSVASSQKNTPSLELRKPKEPARKPWPAEELFAFDIPGDMGMGALLWKILQSRGWKLRAPCFVDVEKEKVSLSEFEASLRGKKKGNTPPVPPHALWLMCHAEREGFLKQVMKERKSLTGPGAAYQFCAFPGMNPALYKTNQSEVLREAPWFPRTFLLPKEKDVALKATRETGTYWIAKPKNDYSGNGISVWQHDDPCLRKLILDNCKDNQKSVLQQYVANPLLVGGYKFHMRIHLVITDVSPLRAYVQEDGQCLFATKKYSLDPKTLGKRFDPPVHLTNMGLNSKPENKANFFQEKPLIGRGQQMRISQLEEYLEKHYAGFNRKTLWTDIATVAKRTAEYLASSKSIRPHLSEVERERHFEVFGMDLMLDTNLKVWMCEANTDPGLTYPDEEVLGSPNPDYTKEKNACTQVWHDLMALLGLDAGRKQVRGSLRHWYELNFNEKSA